MRTISSHILHLLITRLYEVTQVDIVAEVPVSIYPQPSAECMVGGWAIFSTQNFYQTLTAVMRQSLIDYFIALQVSRPLVRPSHTYSHCMPAGCAFRGRLGDQWTTRFNRVRIQ